MILDTKKIFDTSLLLSARPNSFWVPVAVMYGSAFFFTPPPPAASQLPNLTFHVWLYLALFGELVPTLRPGCRPNMYIEDFTLEKIFIKTNTAPFLHYSAPWLKPLGH